MPKTWRVHVQQFGLLGEGGVNSIHVPYTFVAKLVMFVFMYSSMRSCMYVCACVCMFLVMAFWPKRQSKYHGVAMKRT